MALYRVVVLAAALALSAALVSPAFSQNDDLQAVNQLFKQGQFDRALEGVNAYLSTRPKDARGRFLKGLILAEQNKPAEAITVFTGLTQDYPELPEPHNNLAVLYASQGQYEKARAALEMAIRTHPSYATAHENLGDIYAKMASQAYDKALQLDRGNAAAQTKLNLIKELFSSTPSTQPVSAKAGPATKVAVAPLQQKAPAAAPPPAPAAKTPATAPLAKPPAPAPVAKAPATPPQQPAAKPQAEPVAPNQEAAVLAAVKDWAKLWSENDVEGYLAHYASDFDTPDGMSRKDWEAQRKARIAKPRKIQVELTALKVKFDGDRALVTFRQRYRSDTFKADNTKTLIMVKSGDKWLIQQERVGG